MHLDQLAEASRRIIRLNQHPSGSYIACPLFANYAYCWLRDGTFTAYAMDRLGEHDSAARFYEWAGRVIAGKREQVRALVAKQARGEPLDADDFLHTRYHLDGRDDASDWGHFQLDGYGTWLWGLVQHANMTGGRSLLRRYEESIATVTDYLVHFWRRPNFDCWEENPDKIHPSTLAAIYGGLHAYGEAAGQDDLLAAADEIRAFLSEHALASGRFVKYLNADGNVGSADVDASLMWLAQPFGAFTPEHPAMRATLQAIETDLRPSEGIRRYPGDTYYGGGEWVLLTAWYGWLRLESGDKACARQCLRWIADHADAEGRLPEQVRGERTHEPKYREWVERWGVPAIPLLWSHAMYLVLYSGLQEVAE